MLLCTGDWGAGSTRQLEPAQL